MDIIDFCLQKLINLIPNTINLTKSLKWQGLFESKLFSQ